MRCRQRVSPTRMPRASRDPLLARVTLSFGPPTPLPLCCRRCEPGSFSDPQPDDIGRPQVRTLGTPHVPKPTQPKFPRSRRAARSMLTPWPTTAAGPRASSCHASGTDGTATWHAAILSSYSQWPGQRCHSLSLRNSNIPSSYRPLSRTRGEQHNSLKPYHPCAPPRLR